MMKTFVVMVILNITSYLNGDIVLNQYQFFKCRQVGRLTDINLIIFIIFYFTFYTTLTTPPSLMIVFVMSI